MTEDRDARFIDEFEPVRLIARDAADLEVISALLQDAAALSGDLAWLPKQRRFAFVANRYRWERPEAEERVRVGGHVDHVLRVRATGIDPSDKNRPLALLSLRFEPRATPSDSGAALKETAPRAPGSETPARQPASTPDPEEPPTPETPDPGGLLRLICAPDALTGAPIEIALEVEALEIAVRDLTRPWSAKRKPSHSPSDQSA